MKGIVDNVGTVWRDIVYWASRIGEKLSAGRGLSKRD